ncbi:aldose epimerase family protein [Pontiella agarivorans]|uniref:Aldose 1-epimerase n=1 Tax=Pontiella agarivorans TaxID=3038953 RepID=A0ABU5N243_9BACT|nr:aldose epimerase family protein [Pontiella agarivorans]MDZ8120512.1 galactose mutarotase [Pontiella agarivorans]
MVKECTVLGFAVLLSGCVSHKTVEHRPGHYTLRNSGGMEVQLASYGARITSINVPDRDGSMADVVLGYEDINAYKTAQKKPYFGCVVGRYAGRIANGKFALDGREYELAANNGPNHLHGGMVGFDKVEWTGASTHNSVSFSYVSRDGEEGYPGTLQVQVIYTLTDADELIIQYRAATDKATPINLTNHTYFNLAGEGASTVLNHALRIDADCILETDEFSIPTGRKLPVSGTPFDFLRAKAVGRDIDAEHPQLQIGMGYDHTFVLSDGPVSAELYDPESGRCMEVITTEPGIQLYTANYLSGDLVGKSGERYRKRSALCLETQHFPDSPNKPEFPNTILRPGEHFESKTIYRFSVR